MSSRTRGKALVCCCQWYFFIPVMLGVVVHRALQVLVVSLVVSPAGDVAHI